MVSSHSQQEMNTLFKIKLKKNYLPCWKSSAAFPGHGGAQIPRTPLGSPKPGEEEGRGCKPSSSSAEQQSASALPQEMFTRFLSHPTDFPSGAALRLRVTGAS